ncbi:MAG TPA: sensor histidine kinase, partial [Paracoccus sp. (in: a-proteobacteria)]|nr:sensor histidine kinase [Paracoccus sp. (in: a-proteobacteria)]
MADVGSIRRRLLAAGAVTLTAALVAAGLGLAILFDRHVERLAVAELDDRAMALLSALEWDSAHLPVFRETRIDPRYDRPLSGRYWQMTIGGEMTRSRSLWDGVLPVADIPPATGRTRVGIGPGPDGRALLMLDRSVVAGADRVPVRVTVAMARDELMGARQEFVRDLYPYLALLGGILLAASAVQVSVGLRPLSAISRKVAALTEGRIARLGTDLPREVAPLSTQIDALLDARDAELDKARLRAGDLAHGLKSPLQALEGEITRLRDRGEAEIAARITAVTDAMRRHVDHELARFRIRSHQRPAQASPARIAAGVVRVLGMTPKGQQVEWSVPAGPGPLARIDPGDLTEILGAVLVHALRHARSRVALRNWTSG